MVNLKERIAQGVANSATKTAEEFAWLDSQENLSLPLLLATLAFLYSKYIILRTFSTLVFRKPL